MMIFKPNKFNYMCLIFLLDNQHISPVRTTSCRHVGSLESLPQQSAPLEAESFVGRRARPRSPERTAALASAVGREAVLV